MIPSFRRGGSLPNLSRALAIGVLVLASAGAVAGAAESEVIASSRDLTLTRERLDRELAVLPPVVLDQIASDPQAALSFVNGLAKLHAFAAEAERTGVAAQPDVEVAVATARARVLGDALRQHVLANIQEPDFEALARERYQTDKTGYQKPELVRVRHILLKLPADAPEDAVAEKRAQLEAWAAQVRAGASFRDLARQHSEDEHSADLGGDLPQFVHGQMVPAFESAAFALREPGQLSDVVRSPYGLHLIQLIEYQPAGRMSFEEARPFIVSKLRGDYRQSYLDAWEQDLLKNASVQVDADHLRVLMADAKARLVQQPGTPSAGH
jgi:peptidyl-prolyl cis-trans isomerase C